MIRFVCDVHYTTKTGEYGPTGDAETFTIDIFQTNIKDGWIEAAAKALQRGNRTRQAEHRIICVVVRNPNGDRELGCLNVCDIDCEE